MSFKTNGKTGTDRYLAEGKVYDKSHLINRSLKTFWPDIGVAIHRALEAHEIISEELKYPILDLGCSDGRFTSLWNENKSAEILIIGCDLSHTELRNTVSKSGITLAIAADGQRIPLRNCSVRTVIANSVLTHISDIDSALAEIARILKPGGKLLASVPGTVFEEQLAWVRILRFLHFPWLARRAGDRYNLRWQQWHRDGELTWQRRFVNHGLSLLKVHNYPDKRTGFIWSMLFSLINLGPGRFTIFNLFFKLKLMNLGSSFATRLSKILTPLLSEKVTSAGSLFLTVLKDDNSDKLNISQNTALMPRVPVTAKLPDIDSLRKWLTLSKILIRDETPVTSGGYGNFINGRTGHSPMLYSEITGYAVQFWLRQKDNEALNHAVNAGDCLLRIQIQQKDDLIDGAFPFGLSRPEGSPIPAYFSFDAGVCASALTDLALRTGEKRFSEGALRAGLFLKSMQNEDGSFVAMRKQSDHPDIPYEQWFGDRCALHGKNAIALLKLWVLTGDDQWKNAACKTLDWVLNIQGIRGDFPQWQKAPLSMSHTHCYATEGLLYGGLTLNNERYLTAGIRGAEWLKVVQLRSGALNRDYMTAGTGLPRRPIMINIHVGPVAQAVRIWWVAEQITPGRTWTEAALKGLAFLHKIQVKAKTPLIGGAFPQSLGFAFPRIRKNTLYSPWEAFFGSEATRLWTTATDSPAWSIF
jgi:SAM-dependent methyltransferase